MDGQGGPAASGKGFHGTLGPGDQVAPAKTPGIRVARVTGSASSLKIVAVSKARPGPKKAKSAVWPTAVITVSTSRVNSEPGTGMGQERPAGVGLSQLGLLGHQSAHPIFSQQAHRQGKEMKVNAFPAGLLHLRGRGRHEVHGAGIGRWTSSAPARQAERAASTARVAAADDGHPAAQWGELSPR